MYLEPTWLPPDSTPDRELIRWRTDGTYALARGHEGPRRRKGEWTFHDTNIRTHGSGNLTSIDDRASHGCHRLLGVHAVRLGGFLLAHRLHVVRGDDPVNWKRTVRHRVVHP